MFRLLFVIVLALPAFAGVARAECVDGDDCFVDRRGAVRSFDEAYEALHARPERHYVRALLEETLALGVGATWYWVQKEENKKDWDLPGLNARFTGEVLRFDNNTFPINFIWHPLSGAAYYHIGRSNDLGLGFSMLSAIGATLAWEYGLEFREKVSINDLISTPLAGIAIGEVWSKFAWYVNRPVGRGGVAQRISAYSLGAFTAVHDKLDGKGDAALTADDLGLPAELWHRFSLSLGPSLNVTAASDTVAATTRGELAFVAIPSYLRPGKVRRFLHDADVSSLSFSLTMGGEQAWEVDLYADTVLAGFYYQDIAPDQRGVSFLIGSGLGYRYRRADLGGFVDELGITHLPGLSFELDGLLGDGWLHVSTRVSPDFAGIHSLAYPAWQERHPEVATKTVLSKFGYTYDFGLSASFDVSLTLPFVVARVRGLYGFYDSTEGLDRTQETLMADIPSDAAVLDTEGSLHIYPVPGYGLYLGGSLLARRRISRMQDVRAEASLLRALASVGFEL
jgi:hypothetical protein